MPRRVVLVFVGFLVALGGIGLLVYGSQQGLFGKQAKHYYREAKKTIDQGDLETAKNQLEEMIAAFPESQWTDDALFELGQIHRDQDQLADARLTYDLMLARFPDSPLVEQAQLALGDVNVKLLFSSLVTDTDTVYEVKSGNTLAVIARTHGTTVDLIKEANKLSSDIIRPGQRLKIPLGNFEIVVDKSQNQLLLTKDGEFLKLYPVATGIDTTPEGMFEVINRIPHPVWYKQGAVVPPESPANVLGTRWLGLDKLGYGIHGTVDESPIQQQDTAGCVRMVNSDVEELFAIVPVGTRVTIVN